MRQEQLSVPAPSHDSDRSGDRDSSSTHPVRMELYPVKAFLFLILPGLCLVGRGALAWPIMIWPMYSQKTQSSFPLPHVSAVELRIVDADGEPQRLAPVDVLPMGSHMLGERILTRAFDEDEAALRQTHRQYLANSVVRRLNVAGPVTIEGWRIEWDVDKLNVPPLIRSRPARSVPLGRLAVSIIDGTVRVEP